MGGARLEREHGVIAGSARMEQVGGTEIRLIARYRETVRCAAPPRFEIAGGVEWQQHRDRTASDAWKDRRGYRVELHQRRPRARIVARHPALACKGEV